MTASPWLTILGIGEDGVEGLSPIARALLSGAELVVGGRRHLALADSLVTGERLAWPSPLTDAFPALLARRGRPVAVLASGDPFCHGVGALLARAVPIEEIDCRPAPSAFSLACARLGWALHDTVTISFCGHPVAGLIPHLQPGARILALSADAATPAAIADLLDATGFAGSRARVLEALGGPHERIYEFDRMANDVACLNLLAIDVVAGPDARPVPLAAGLPDDWFEHDGQLTKREVRAATLAVLAPHPGEHLWDIGCGSGSVGIEWLLRHPRNRATAIEARADRAARAGRNAAKFGAALDIRHGRAPDALHELSTPDAVFIGGGAAASLDSAWAALRPGGRLVVNAVTVETEAMLIAARARLGGDLTRLAIQRLEPVGPHHGFRPAMTVTQFAAVKP